MDEKTLLRKKRAEWELKKLAGFRPVPIVEVEEIPEVKTLFPGTKNDYWVKLHEEENGKTSCKYTMDGLSNFGTHIHKYYDEQVTLLTEGAKVKWVDEDDIYYYEYPATFAVPKGVMHALESLVNFPIDIQVDWMPKFDDKIEFDFK